MNVTIYSTSICPACETLTKWLNSVNVAYTKKVTDTDPEIMAEFMSVNDGNVGVPFSIVTADDGTETKIAGYDQKKFKEALGI